MKKRVVILSVFISFALSVFSQGSQNPACVGYIYVDVDLNCDKTERGYASYPVPTPNGEEYYPFPGEGWPSHVLCLGPGAPYITQFTEDQPMLHVRLRDLEIMRDTGEYFAYIDAPVGRSVPNMGNPWSEPVQCYYTIVLVILTACNH